MTPGLSNTVWNADGLKGFLDDLLHPERKYPADQDTGESDPGRPFTPPPLESTREEDDDDDDGPSLPMTPALA